MFEDTNVWYKGKETFASHTNAGAVRIFEAKKIYPHSGVVEFTRFGNLDRAMHQTEREAGFYDQMGLYFKPSNLPFKRTNFEMISIKSFVSMFYVFMISRFLSNTIPNPSEKVSKVCPNISQHVPKKIKK